MKQRIFLFLISFVLLTSCNSELKVIQNTDTYTVIIPKSKKLTVEQVNYWQHKDIKEDSIPGISLDKAYRELLLNKIADTVIIAVMDTRLDTEHEEIKKFIWTNTDEIPNNGIDDDKNGYIDDIHGWNFLADANGNNIFDLNYSYVRFYKKFKNKYEGKQGSEISDSDKLQYKLFLKAKETINSKLKLRRHNIRYLDSLANDGKQAINELKKIYPNSTLDQKFLNEFNSNDSLTKSYAARMQYYLNIKDAIKENLIDEKKYFDIYLNEDYPDIKNFNDDYLNLRDIKYGNNRVSISENDFSHSTQVTGVLIADRSNNIGVKGITNVAKIMPIAVSPMGSERDKDIALGIRYAVNNGAKIINITFTKEFPLNNDWVSDAIKYASKNDVLIVSSSGNGYSDLDFRNSYPNDSDDSGVEFSKNFIKVGASWFKLNERMVPSFSNYGKKEVDIFAPGKYIYTTLPKNKYDHADGTSMSSPIVSGVAALIRSYYPNLTAAEVKQIIMESGVSYDIMVNKPSTSKEKELVPFSSLSKSGKIVNAYNALLLAEKVSKSKRKSKK